MLLRSWDANHAIVTDTEMRRWEFAIPKQVNVTVRTIPKDLSVKCATGTFSVILKEVANAIISANPEEC